MLRNVLEGVANGPTQGWEKQGGFPGISAVWETRKVFAERVEKKMVNVHMRASGTIYIFLLLSIIPENVEAKNGLCQMPLLLLRSSAAKKAAAGSHEILHQQTLSIMMLMMIIMIMLNKYYTRKNLRW